MEFWENILYGIGSFFGAIARGFERALTGLFGSSNERYIKSLEPKIEAINKLEERYASLSDEELRDQTRLFRERLDAGETLDDLLVEAFAVCREAGRRWLSMRHYDVQLVGGIVLHSGNAAEMVTGEGKTLVATLPAYLNAIEGRGVHVITVNDYLARRDMEWMAPLYMGLGLTVGCIQQNMDAAERQKAYACDITYGTNNEFGFDYLRDNMRSAIRGDDRYPKREQQAQGTLNYAIIDEVDNILIDEARTPLIISGPAHQDAGKYAEADRIARKLKGEEHFQVNEKDHNVTLTDSGVREAERLAGVESFYTAGNMEWPHLIDNALKAHYLYKRDVQYVIEDGKIVIVDEFTGRKMPGRQWSDGLHQAVEAKERVQIKEETQTLATITLQNFFKLYKKICGMTGTAMTEATELYKIYGLDVIAIPTNKVLQRIEYTDLIYCTEREKYEAIAEEIERTVKWDVLIYPDESELWGTIVKEDGDRLEFQRKGSRKTEQLNLSDFRELQRKGRPVLVGTVSIEKSERLAELLTKRGIPHEVLNAKYHKREAEIVAQAGRIGHVTIATNMAGRGTDIILGGNAETMAWAQLQHRYPTRLDVPEEEWEALVKEIDDREGMKVEGKKVRELGGLKVIGTERHDSRRIDLQLRGRCGRQGDPGSSRFYLSLEDDLVRKMVGGEWVQAMMRTLGMEEGEAIENSLVVRRIEDAQQKVEERNFEIRKNLLEYDEVMDEQRKRVYSYRQRILAGHSAKGLVLEMIEEQVRENLSAFLDANYGVDSFAAWVSKELRLPEKLDASLFAGEDFPTCDRIAKDQAERIAETQILDAIDENLPDLGEDMDADEWNWSALAAMANSRWGLNLRDRDLKKIGRAGVSEFLIQEAHRSILRADLTAGKKFLEKDFGLQNALAWVQAKFDFEIAIGELRGREPEEIERIVLEKAIAAYEQRELEYPVLAGLSQYASRDGVRREQLVEWAQRRFQTGLAVEDLKGKQRDEIRNLLKQHSQRAHDRGQQELAALRHRLERLLPPEDEIEDAGVRVGHWAGGNGKLESLQEFLRDELRLQLDDTQLSRLELGELTARVESAIEERFRPEMRRMERELLLNIVDDAWKEHLLSMDYLRSAVAFRGYSQVDPKVEYKREGMRMFNEMWKSIGERTTNLIFRVENLNEDFVRQTWQVTEMRHDEAPSALADASAGEPAGNEGAEPAVIEPIRNRQKEPGRNDPCPCGSGKKYKKCCGALRHV